MKIGTWPPPSEISEAEHLRGEIRIWKEVAFEWASDWAKATAYPGNRERIREMIRDSYLRHKRIQEDTQ